MQAIVQWIILCVSMSVVCNERDYDTWISDQSYMQYYYVLKIAHQFQSLPWRHFFQSHNHIVKIKTNIWISGGCALSLNYIGFGTRKDPLLCVCVDGLYWNTSTSSRHTRTQAISVFNTPRLSGAVRNINQNVWFCATLQHHFTCARKDVWIHVWMYVCQNESTRCA